MKNTFQKFHAFCSELEDEHPYYYPKIERYRSTDWIINIFDHQEEDRRKLIAQGQSETMEGAIDSVMLDHAERQRVAARKEELLKEPLVREALELFTGKKLDPSTKESSAPQPSSNP